MSPIVDFFDGNGRLDTGLRALALVLVLGVGVAMVWTTLSLRRDVPAAGVHLTTAEASVLLPLSDPPQEIRR